LEKANRGAPLSEVVTESKTVSVTNVVAVGTLSAAAHPPATVFTDVKDIDYDSTIKYDASFFNHLNNVIQSEPWIDRDRVMIDQLRSLGIEKGKPYQPSDQLKATLNSAAQDARAFLYAKYDQGFPSFFPPSSRWMFPSYPDLVKAASSSYADLNAYPLDERAVVYSVAFIGIKNLGGGPDVPLLHQGQGWARLRRRKDLQTDRPAQRPRKTVLVAHRLRPRAQHPHQGSEPRQPLLADP
jgi:hypothetical protein